MLTRSVAFAFGALVFAASVSAASDHAGVPEWGFDIDRTAENTVCRLTLPIEESSHSVGPVKLWANFFWLENSSVVSDKVLPGGVPVFVLSVFRQQSPAGGAMEAEPGPPDSVIVEGLETSVYVLSEDLPHSYHFVAGGDAEQLLRAASAGDGGLDVTIAFSDQQPESLRIPTSRSQGFDLYAEVFRHCGSKLAKQSLRQTPDPAGPSADARAPSASMTAKPRH